MIKLTRIDDRLVHGQVAFTWTPALGIDCLLVANDKLAGDEFQKMALGLAKPAGVTLLIRTVREAAAFLNDTKSQGYKILVLIDSVKDAHALSQEVPAIRSVNVGGIRAKEGATLLSKAVALTGDDVLLARELLGQGIELEVRQVPTDKKQMLEKLLPS
ncbi:PTS system mannose/fructose/N-acetylgalactosamine-transporter subunit IIB [Dinghuibacter silviterrae]|uniref:Fructoselysine and glucoselysine-specific PTS system IIB component n=1 Tax=Dinghuibacter silviterrae TaxID=1539049 RepID=A0A4R8DJU4_9BACT|nr:PTS sugar transporter subunit IIB [Dinghuibacter silviterrae]TDW97456.1 fructoselysine and glucoselysine-specific PTS system IIB component [Dinghuibacter silviterrae]